jgi:hypothetical protein
MWEMESVRVTAIKQLEKYGEDDPLLRLIIAKRLNIPHWFVPAMSKLCQRSTPLDHKGLTRLSVLGNPQKVFEFMLKIGQVRESFGQTNTKNTSTWYRDCHNFAAEIVRIFQYVSVSTTSRAEGTDRVFNWVVETEDQAMLRMEPQECSWDFS